MSRWLRWFKYEQTQRWAIQLLMIKSRMITNHVLNVHLAMQRMGIPIEEARLLWTRDAVLGVARRHPEFFG